MVQNAIVKQLLGEGLAQVSLLRQMECGLHCDGACAGCSQKPPQEILALAANPIGAKPGDLVEVEPSVGHDAGLPVVVFLLPCLGLGGGYALGQALLELGEVAALGTGALGLALGFVPALWLDRAMRRSQKPEFSILRQLR